MSYKKVISLFLLITCAFVPVKPVTISYIDILCSAALGALACFGWYKNYKENQLTKLIQEAQQKLAGMQQLQALRIPLSQQIHQQLPLSQTHKMYQQLRNYLM